MYDIILFLHNCLHKISNWTRTQKFVWLSVLFQTIIPPPLAIIPPLVSQQQFSAEGRKKLGVFNELKRSKMRFSAPLAPRKFWDFEVSHNTPLVSQHLKTRGGIMGRNSTDGSQSRLLKHWFVHIIVRATSINRNYITSHSNEKWCEKLTMSWIVTKILKLWYWDSPVFDNIPLVSQRFA